ncbi:MAG: PKD-like domain-containing protein [Bacteroidota bacterium]
MGKTFTKALFILLLPLLVITATTSAQTITVGAVDPGPYGQGSSISVPFNVTGSCISNPANKFNLYLSNATGNFGAGETLIGSYTGFYATFVNGIIPATVAGGNYRVQVRSTLPGINSTASNTFNISALPGLKAGASSSQINAAVDPEIFGSCVGTNNRNYTFTNISDGGNPATATFFNELSQTSEGTLPLNCVFMAKAANYTVTVKASNAGGIIGTRSYQLINNVANNSFTITGNGSVCLGAGNTLEYNVDITGDNGIQNNYPGLLYNIKWGDGGTSIFTLCQIVAANGKVSHAYTTSSCGNVANNQKNVFQIDIQPTSPFCTNITQPVTTYAKVLAQPQNRFDAPVAACLGSPVTFANNSIPGDNPNSTTTDCRNNSATYTWLIDGVVVATGRALTTPLVHTFTTSGNHSVTLRFENNSGLCDATDLTKQVCIQKAPIPDFTIPATYCLTSGPLAPVNTSVVDEVCNTNTTYTWSLVSGSATGVTFAANVKTPNFNFTQTGVYRFRLNVTTQSCGTVTGPVKEIVVNSTPTVTLSPDAIQCGKGVTLDFSPTATATKATLTGTAVTLPNTYNWIVTGASGGTVSFANNTTANSQYPRITFNDYDVYTITATHTNSCGGPVSASQKLTFVAAPTVSAGPPQNNICEGTPIILTGTPGVGGLITDVRWTSTTGGTFTTLNSPNATYTPSAADINAGQVLLTYTATTSLPAPCNQIPSTVLITIVKKATVTSSNTQSVCSGEQFTYVITSANAATTFTWATALTSGTASGFGATGSGATINDIITNNGNIDAVVTYTITPTLNGCTGTPFTLKLTVHPLPVLTAIPVDASICSNQPANITLTSNINPTKYTWTSVASAGITGNTNSGTATTVASIQDILVNSAATQGIVSYTITPYNGTCPGSPKQAIVTVKPAPIQSVAGPDEAICISNTYKLNGNDPAPGTGKWTVTSGQAGISFSNDADPNAIVSGLQPGQIYKFQWTITAAPTCPSTQSTVTITNNAEAVGGTTTGTATVCAPTNNGSVILSGYIGNIIRWESSVNGGSTWLPITNITATLSYSNLTQTTQYRAVISGGACGNEFSTVTTITVNQPAIIANAGPDNPQCNVTTVNLQGNNPGVFVGEWTQIAGPAATIVTPADPLSQITGLIPGNSYTFRWTIKGVLPCGDSFDDVVIVDKPDVIASFVPSQTQACGPTEITFNNTSSPVLPGTVYEWNFGDGSPVSSIPKHTFRPGTDGRDITYTVSLTVVGNCVVRQPVIATITISPAKPDARINPSEVRSCGVLNLTVDNLSPGTNDTYTFYLIDENNNQVTSPITKTNNDKSPAVFQAINPTHIATWHLYMEAKDKCGNINRSPEFQIPVSPSNIISNMQIKDNLTYVCLGTPVFFRNLSAGGDAFKYIIYDENKTPITNFPGGLAELSYTFPNVGSYYVSITASNSGCGDAPPSELIPIQVYPLPRPQFTYTIDVDNKVKFTNTTPSAGNTPATSLTYVWNFGDGTAPETSFTPNDHTYDYTRSPYTVSLTARNPGTSCEGIVTKTIEIKFTGELFLPNAFQPASTVTDLRTFKAKGQKLKEWRMQIFNNWGQLIWQTTALGNNGEPTEGWDGTFKGAPVQQGVYVWQASATFINGTEWKGMSYKGSLPKRSGYIHLLR